MNETAYGSYLASHKAWLDEVTRIEVVEHEKSLIKRALKTVREEVSFEGVVGPERPPTRTVTVKGYPKVDVKSTKKTEHKPILSMQPHRAEKRVEKKKLRDARVAATVVEVKARTEQAPAKMDSKIEVIKQVEKIEVRKPLWKAEEAAATSAAKRSNTIKFGSVDLVGNVAAEDDWKVVTRKKGSDVRFVGEVTETLGGVINRWGVNMDPSVGVKALPKAAVRRPETVVGK